MYQLRLLDAAVDDLARLDKSVARRITKRLGWFTENFDLIQHIPLTGNLAGLYKLRIGDYRIVYEILHDEHVILVHFMGALQRFTGKSTRLYCSYPDSVHNPLP